MKAHLERPGQQGLLESHRDMRTMRGKRTVQAVLSLYLKMHPTTCRMDDSP